MEKPELNQPGIYKIQNRISGKMYVGSAANIRKRWAVHQTRLRCNRHHNVHLSNAFVKHGERNFEWTVLEYCSLSDLINREQYWIDFYKSYDRLIGYNLSPTASSCLGVRHSDAARENMRLSQLGRKHSPEARAKKSKTQWKKVYQFDRRGNLIKEFESLLAAQAATGIRRQSISGCCRVRKKCNFAGNFRWSFNPQIEVVSQYRSKRIKHLSTGKEYFSINEAASDSGYDPKTIRRKIKIGEYEIV